MSGARERERGEIELRFQSLSKLTIPERDALAADIDRVHGRTIRSRLKGRFDLDDDESLTIWMDTLLAALLHPETFRPESGSLRSWLSGIARHLAVKFVSTAARRGLAATALERHMLDKMPEPRHADPSITDGDTVEAVLSPLCKPDADLVRARYLEGWSLAELGEATDRSPKAVQSRIYRILKKVRQMWRKGPNRGK